MGRLDLGVKALPATTLHRVVKPIATFLRNSVRTRKNRHQATPTCDLRLQHLKRIGFSPRVVYDCGAYIGRWTRAVAQVFPGLQCVLCEPNRSLLPRITENIASIEPAPLVLDVAVGDRPGAAELNIWGNDQTTVAGSSLLAHVQGDAGTRLEVSVDTIDQIAERMGHCPDLLKLDLQGAELAALTGAKHVLESAEVVIVEFGCLDAYVDRTTPRDIMDLLYDRDYCLYDIVDLIYRPYDGALTGGDFFFVKKNSPLKAYKGFA